MTFKHLKHRVIYVEETEIRYPFLNHETSFVLEGLIGRGCVRKSRKENRECRLKQTANT